MALSSWRASIVQSIRVARGFLWLIASKRSLTSRESWPQTQASFKSRFHKVLWISLVVSPVLYCSYLCINQGPWFASLHICPPHFKAMQDLFVSVDESPWMWDTEKHVNICQLHTGGGEQTEQWYCFFFGGLFNSSMLLLCFAAVCVVLVILSAWGKGWRCWISVMHEPFYRGWHVFRQIPSYEDAAKGLTENRWKPLQTQDVFWVASALALWWQDFGLRPILMELARPYRCLRPENQKRYDWCLTEGRHEVTVV